MTAPAAAVDTPGEGRIYPIPRLDPETGEIGEIVELPNITGILSVIDPKHLCDWNVKMTLLGAALREDLQVMVAAANLLPAGKPRNKDLRRLAELAHTAGQIIEKAMVPSDRGTGYHSLTERLDELVPAGAVDRLDELHLPKTMKRIAHEYVACMAGVTILHTEVTVANFTHGFAGTGDRVIAFQPMDAWTAIFDQYDLATGCFIFDNKFGEVHDEVAMQLAAIAMGETIWDAATGTHIPMPADLRRDIGFVFNPDKGLLPVDLTGAADAFLGALAVDRYAGVKPLRPALGKVSAGGVPGSQTFDGVSSVGQAPPADPVHISEPLAEVTTAIVCLRGQGGCQTITIPADVFHGLPDANGQLQIDQTAKRAQLLERLVALKEVPGGLEQVAARWPVTRDGISVPTFQQTTEHTADQLAFIEAAIAAVEGKVNVPWPQEDLPPRIPNDDSRVTSLIGRLENLPQDLQAAVRVEARKTRVPNLREGYVTEAHLTAVEPLVAAAEAEWMPRAKRITESLQLAQGTNSVSNGASEAAMLAALGVADPRAIHGAMVDQLDWLALTVVGGVIVERDGRLVVDLPAQVLENYGGDGALLKAARLVAKKNGWRSPISAAVVLTDPLLTAALTAV